jgi:hypothetical protein
MRFNAENDLSAEQLLPGILKNILVAISMYGKTS